MKSLLKSGIGWLLKMKNLSKTKIVVLATSFTAVVTALGYLGIAVPRPAWSFELEEVQAENIDTRMYFYDSRLDSLHKQKRQVQREIHQSQGNTPAFYTDELADIENNIRRLEGDIEGLQKRKEGL